MPPEHPADEVPADRESYEAWEQKQEMDVLSIARKVAERHAQPALPPNTRVRDFICPWCNYKWSGPPGATAKDYEHCPKCCGSYSFRAAADIEASTPITCGQHADQAAQPAAIPLPAVGGTFKEPRCPLCYGTGLSRMSICDCQFSQETPAQPAAEAVGGKLPADLRAWARLVVDAAWNACTEGDAVPATEWADRIINSVPRYKAAPAAELESILPSSWYADRPFATRLQFMVENWRNLVESLQVGGSVAKQIEGLEAELAAANERSDDFDDFARQLACSLEMLDPDKDRPSTDEILRTVNAKLKAFAALEADRDKLKLVIANDCEDEEAARAEAAKYLGEEARGNSDCVPGAVELVKMLGAEIDKLRGERDAAEFRTQEQIRDKQRICNEYEQHRRKLEARLAALSNPKDEVASE